MEFDNSLRAIDSRQPRFVGSRLEFRLSDVIGDLDHPPHRALGVADRMVGGPEPDQPPVLMAPDELTAARLATPQSSPEFDILGQCGILLINKDAMMLTTDLLPCVAEGTEEDLIGL